MAAPVKGQATLDAAKARQGMAKANKPTARSRQGAANAGNGTSGTGSRSIVEKPNDAALLTMTKESGYEKPKSLRELEHIVADNALRGAGYWRKSADALLAIKTHKLWKKATDKNGEAYPSFVVYAEDRFGFKKTYAYDLVKAASRKPEALTEGAARAEMSAEREQKPVTIETAVLKMNAAHARFEDSAGNWRDRAIEHEDFVHAYDQTLRLMGDVWRDFVEKWTPIPGEATEKVNPEREPEDSADAETEG